MKIDSFHRYKEKNNRGLSKIATKLASRNKGYDLYEIKGMIDTAIWESEKEKPKLREIYLRVLNRILEEKGYKYIGNEPFTPFVNPESDMEVGAPQDYYDFLQTPDRSFTIERIFLDSGMTQEEVFVTVLTYGIEAPSMLKGERKETVDNLEPLYNIRSLTKKEIAELAGLTISELNKVRKSAFDKLEKVKCLYRKSLDKTKQRLILSAKLTSQ